MLTPSEMRAAYLAWLGEARAALQVPSRIDGPSLFRYPEWHSKRKVRGRRDRSLKMRSNRRKGAARTAKVLALVVLLTLQLRAQNAPQPTFAVRGGLDWALLAADSSMRSLDVYSTHRMLERGNHELFLPSPIAHHSAVLAAYGSGAVLFDSFLRRELLKHGHPRLGRLVVGIDAGQDGFWAVHNLFLGRTSPARAANVRNGGVR